LKSFTLLMSSKTGLLPFLTFAFGKTHHASKNFENIKRVKLFKLSNIFSLGQDVLKKYNGGW
ncbi:MAG: hypothetical protein KDD34_02660, partial [Bdellovibrionales bacterium]|nr:hypothetical protein [Bdellovibrionales bacterium]